MYPIRGERAFCPLLAVLAAVVGAAVSFELSSEAFEWPSPCILRGWESRMGRSYTRRIGLASIAFIIYPFGSTRQCKGSAAARLRGLTGYAGCPDRPLRVGEHQSQRAHLGKGGRPWRGLADKCSLQETRVNRFHRRPAVDARGRARDRRQRLPLESRSRKRSVGRFRRVSPTMRVAAAPPNSSVIAAPPDSYVTCPARLRALGRRRPSR